MIKFEFAGEKDGLGHFLMGSDSRAVFAVIDGYPSKQRMAPGDTLTVHCFTVCDDVGRRIGTISAKFEYSGITLSIPRKPGRSKTTTRTVKDMAVVIEPRKKAPKKKKPT